jgi:ribosome biogenesis GTPase
MTDWAKTWGWRGEPWSGDGELARVTAEFRGGYLVQCEHGELKAGSSGKLRRAIKVEGADKPAVGDWVVMASRAAEGSALLGAVLPRLTCVQRKAAGSGNAVAQVVAANVDVALVVTAVADDLNVRRLERYLAAVRGSGARAAVALSKIDLVEPEAVARAVAEVQSLGEVEVFAISTRAGTGLDALERLFADNSTVALVGSSGVGKSTLINRWLGGEVQSTLEVREDGRGRHSTTHRELFLRPAGGLVMDTPGMRELGLWEAEEAIAETFDDVAALAGGCRFRDCGHAHEPGCAVREALERGELTPERVEAWKKLSGELDATSASARQAKKRATKVIAKAYARLVKDRDRGSD